MRGHIIEKCSSPIGDGMMAAGFKDTKGKPIKNAQEWETACKKLQECNITISSQTGKHTYSAWLQEEMKKREAGGNMGKGMEPETGTEPGRNGVSG